MKDEEHDQVLLLIKQITKDTLKKAMDTRRPGTKEMSDALFDIMALCIHGLAAVEHNPATYAKYQKTESPDGDT